MAVLLRHANKTFNSKHPFVGLCAWYTSTVRAQLWHLKVFVYLSLVATAGMVKVPNFGSTPLAGERILVLREEWLKRILEGSKDLEIRGLRMREGDIWLGCRSVIYGKARLGPAITIRSECEFAALRPRHRIAKTALPYKNTFGLPIAAVKRLQNGVPYVHARGAIGVVKFRAP
jgi:hypothetical protein